MHAHPLRDDDLLLVAAGKRTRRKLDGLRLDTELMRQGICEAEFFLVIDDTALGKRIHARERNVLFDGEIKDEPFCLAVLCDEAEAQLDGIERLFDLDFLAGEVELAFLVRIHTEDRSHDFRAASAHEAGNAQDFPLLDREGNIFKDTRLRKVFHLEYFITGDIRARRIVLAHHAADHIADDLVHIRFFCRAAADGLPVTHDRDGIAIIENLFHSMRNIDDGDALRLQLSHDFEKTVSLTLRQSGSRFIHDDRLRIEHQVSCDFCHLLLSDRAFPCDLIERQRDAHFLTLFFRHLPHLFEINEAKSRFRLIHQEKILQNRQIRPDIQLLMNESDPVLFRIFIIAESHFLAIHQNGAGIRLVDARQNIH